MKEEILIVNVMKSQQPVCLLYLIKETEMQKLPKITPPKMPIVRRHETVTVFIGKMKYDRVLFRILCMFQA